MPLYIVPGPIAGHARIEIEADTEADAIRLLRRLRLIDDAVGEITLDHIEDVGAARDISPGECLLLSETMGSCGGADPW